MKCVISLATPIRLWLWMMCFVAVFLFSSLAMAHGGEDHGEDAPKAEAGSAARITASSENFELTGLPTAMSGGKLVLYLSEFWTNKPVTGAKLSVSAGEETRQAEAVGDHYELAAPWVNKPGSYPLTISIEAKDVSDLMIGTLDIPAQKTGERHETIWDHVVPHDFAVPPFLMLGAGVFAALLFAVSIIGRGFLRRTALAGFVLVALIASGSAALSFLIRDDHHAGESAVLDLPDNSKRAPDGSIFMPRSAQSLLGVETLRTAKAESVQRTLSFAGQVIADPNRSGVVQSMLAGRLEPPEGGFPAIGSKVKEADVLGYLVPRVELIDQSDIRQTTGDLDRQIALAEAKVARYDKLKGVLAEALITDAHLELEGLKQRKAAIKPVLGERQSLIAPSGGMIAEANAASGQVVDAQAILFRIVDPQSLFVEALAFDLSAAAEIERAAKTATATTADGRQITLEFAGRGLSLRQQAVPLRYRVKSGGEDLSLGQPVTVAVPVSEPVSAIVVPRASVVRAQNGQQVVFTHVAPERFEARPVALETIDATRFGVTAGLDADVRIVGRGAELINQIR